MALGQLVGAVFRHSGMRPNDAALLADTLVTADRRGCTPTACCASRSTCASSPGGGVDPQGRPAVVRQVGACLVVDGGNSMGQIGAHFAMRRAIEVAGGSLGAPGGAPGTGIAAAAVRGSNHCGAMAYYAMQALPADMIGLATTNAPPTMAPWGARSACWGSTPWPWPSPPEKSCPSSTTPFSATAHGKVRVYRQKGLDPPPGWALDRDGRPTTDPAGRLWTASCSPSGASKAPPWPC